MTANELILLPIFKDSSINIAFVKANLAVLKKHADIFANIADPYKKTIKLKELWLLEYNIEVQDENNQIKNLKFSNESALTLFLIQWG